MNYDQFLEKMVSLVEAELTTREEKLILNVSGSMAHVHVKIQNTTKNNGVVKSGIMFMEEENNVCPTIYLEDYFERFKHSCIENPFLGCHPEKELQDIALELADAYEKIRVESSEELFEFEKYNLIKDKVTCRLINYEKNKELLKDSAHIKFLDLAVVFYVVMEDWTELGNQSVALLVKWDYLSLWEISLKELEQDAKVNTLRMFPIEFKGMQEMLNKMDVPLHHEGKECIYILTNKSMMYGAAAIYYPGLMQHVAEYFDSDFYILPSSIHEVILVPVIPGFTAPKEELNDMVRHINETELCKTDVLADHVYYYSKENYMLSY